MEDLRHLNLEGFCEGFPLYMYVYVCGWVKLSNLKYCIIMLTGILFFWENRIRNMGIGKNRVLYSERYYGKDGDDVWLRAYGFSFISKLCQELDLQLGFFLVHE